MVAEELWKWKADNAIDGRESQVPNLIRRDHIMPTITRSGRKNKFTVLEKQLASQRNELRLRINRHRMDAVIDRELDDEAAAAVENATKDMLAVTLERERRTLNEVESALIRMKKGEYGICDHCGTEIPKARLEALPWARLCIHCAESATNSKSFQVSL
jgi:DnaK suppressor protein